MSDTNELKDTVEKLRQEKYVDLPASLVDEILTIEAEWLEDRVQALRLIDQAVEKYLSSFEEERA
jgi:hypothetical protein